MSDPIESVALEQAALADRREARNKKQKESDRLAKRVGQLDRVFALMPYI